MMFTLDGLFKAYPSVAKQPLLTLPQQQDFTRVYHVASDDVINTLVLKSFVQLLRFITLQYNKSVYLTIVCCSQFFNLDVLY